MKIPRNLQGRDLVNHLIRHWQFKEERQRGSHIIVATDIPITLTISIPAHKPLRLGTLRNILNSVADHKHVTIDTLLADL